MSSFNQNQYIPLKVGLNICYLFPLNLIPIKDVFLLKVTADSLWSIQEIIL